MKVFNRRGGEEEREREFVVKCEQSWAKEDIAEYQSSPLQYCCNCTEEILTILAIPKILQVFPIYTILVVRRTSKMSADWCCRNLFWI